jgi:G3E family GTPase
VALTLFLEALAEHCGDDVLRLKGIVNILESPNRSAVIHGVQHVFMRPPGSIAGRPTAAAGLFSLRSAFRSVGSRFYWRQ